MRHAHLRKCLEVRVLHEGLVCGVSPWELTGQMSIHSDGGEIDADEISGQRDLTEKEK